MKGESDTRFVFGLVIFLAFIVFFSGMITALNPEFTLLTNVDTGIIATEAIGIAGACVISTGIPCAAAVVIGSIFGLVTVTNTLFNTLIILPSMIVLAFVMARLARGNG